MRFGTDECEPRSRRSTSIHRSSIDGAAQSPRSSSWTPAAIHADSAAAARVASTRIQSVSKVEIASTGTPASRSGSRSPTRTPTNSKSSVPGIDHARKGPARRAASVEFTSGSDQPRTTLVSSGVRTTASSPERPAARAGTSAPTGRRSTANSPGRHFSERDGDVLERADMAVIIHDHLERGVNPGIEGMLIRGSLPERTLMMADGASAAEEHG